MLLSQKMLRHLSAVSSSWGSFYKSNEFSQDMLQRLRSRSLPTYLALAACLTTVASLLLLSLGRIRYHWDSQIWDVNTTWPQGIVDQSTPRDLAANNTLGVSIVINGLYITIMILQLTLIVPEVTRVGQRFQLALTRTRSRGEDNKPYYRDSHSIILHRRTRQRIHGPWPPSKQAPQQGLSVGMASASRHDQVFYRQRSGHGDDNGRRC